MSWETGTHNMAFIAITKTGAWHGFLAQGDHDRWDYDQHARFSLATYVRGGCQAPSSWAYWPVWTNCHVENYP